MNEGSADTPHVHDSKDIADTDHRRKDDFIKCLDRVLLGHLTRSADKEVVQIDSDLGLASG